MKYVAVSSISNILPIHIPSVKYYAQGRKSGEKHLGVINYWEWTSM